MASTAARSASWCGPEPGGLEEGQVDEAGLGELRRTAEAAPLGIEATLEFVHRRGQQVRRLSVAGVEEGRRVRHADHRGALGDGPGQLVGLFLHLVAPVLPDVGEGVEDGGERRPALEIGGWEVGAAVEGSTVGGEEHAHRPATGTGDGLDRLHVDGVDVGSLLAVDLHADERRVEALGHDGVLERLVGHDVAPVAGRVAHGQEDRPVLGRGPGERLLAPRVPVDRVVRVLLQVGTGLGGQAVGGGHPVRVPPGPAGTSVARRRPGRRNRASTGSARGRHRIGTGSGLT